MTRHLVAHAPIVVSGRLRDIETRAESLLMRWRRPDGWQERIVERGVALNSRKFVELAAEGFPVSSNTAKGLTKYIDAVEAINWEKLPTTNESSRLGWQGRDGHHGFLCGRTLVAPNGDVVERDGGELGREAVSFRGVTPGDEQIADGFQRRGSIDNWLRAVKSLQGHPRALAALYAAFVPPVLQLIGCANFIMNWWYRTSGGKTTALRVAGSVWGNPNEEQPDSVLHSWDCTQVYVERLSGIVSSLPILLDETKRVRDPRFVASVLYQVAQGQGRGRGDTRSIASTRTWHTVLLSTGEAPVISFTQDGGTRARTLEIRGAPFGTVTAESARMVNELNLAVRGNYGHAGVAFIQSFTRRRSEWGRIAEEYRALVGEYCAAAPEGSDPAITSRLAHYAAAVEIAAKLAHEALELPWQFADALRELWAELLHEASDAAGDERALLDVLSYAHAHKQMFYGRHVEDYITSGGKLISRMPFGGWAGRWDSNADWEFIAFHPTVLNKVLTDHGYNAEAILSAWKERGWLKTGNDRKRYTCLIRIDNDRQHTVVITRAAIEEVEPTGALASGDGGDTVETAVETE